MQCPRCGHENPVGAKFCSACGQPAGAQGSGLLFSTPQAYTPKHLADRILTSRAALEGERKQVTVLFADLKGSLELLADRDPEDARQMLDPVLERMMEAVHRYEGTVNQVMGDGIMALFGAPIAHEDHAVRACYAALRMQDSVKGYARDLWRAEGVPIQIRVGLNSGEVVVRSVGSDLRMDYTAVGQTTHLAARMEQIAMPGSVLLGSDTLRLVEGYVQVRPLGVVSVKGLEEAVEAFELLGAGRTRTRLQATASRGLTRFVGRDTELDQLRQALERACERHGQVVAAVGEPGVGKSRLFYELVHSHRTQACLVLEAASVSYGRASSYLPVVDVLKTYFGIETQDDPRRVREKVLGKVLGLDEGLRSSLSPLLELMDVPAEDPAWQALDPPQRRPRTIDAVKRLLLRESQVQPLVLVFEDLHWIDSETQAVLDSLVESLPTAHVLLLVNYRPEYEHRWGSKTYYTQLRLDPLPPESADELLHALLGEGSTLQALRRLLIERTEGNPFFLEETVRALVETGALAGERGAYGLAKPVETAQVPATVQAVLAARIDRLPAEAKRLLQLAAVVGKDVPYVLLQTIAETPEDQVRQALGHLQGTEFLYEARLFRDLEYTFKHALTHEVTYASLLHDRRRALHGRVLEAMEGLPGLVADQVERLAHHAVRAEAWDQAAEYLHQAGRKALARSGYQEAIASLGQALEALEHLPADRQRTERIIDVRIDLGPALAALRGRGAGDAEQNYVLARQLCEPLGDAARLFPILWNLSRSYDARGGGLQTARQLGIEMEAAAERAQDPGLLLEAHHTQWATLYLLGDFEGVVAHCEQGLALYDPARHRHHAAVYGGHDSGGGGLIHAARSAWLLGYPDRALQRMEAGLALARQLDHPLSLTMAMQTRALLHQWRGEPAEVEHWAGGAQSLAEEHGLARHALRAATDRAWAAAQRGDYGGALGQLLQGKEQWEGGDREVAYYHCRLAGTLEKAGRVEDGLTAVAEAMAFVDATGQRLFEAELHRIKGELLLKKAGPDDAEACFHRARELARSQKAKAWELRAATSLARLWADQGKRPDGHRLLADVYGWFTEGFETADLLEAKTLLVDLA